MMPLFKDLKRKLSEVKEGTRQEFCGFASLLLFFHFPCPNSINSIRSYANYSLYFIAALMAVPCRKCHLSLNAGIFAVSFSSM
jgi:hypothetical protein